jgi:signal transduction histidine kinase
LETSFNQAIRFSGDAAHELKTPLAIIQGQLERAIADAPAGSETQKNMTQALDEARRITAICRKLLLLSQADAGKLSLHYERIDLTTLLEELADDARLLASALTIHTHIGTGITVHADRDLLQQTLQNLITNAIKYNIPNGWLLINATQTNNAVTIEVKNSSQGLDEKTSGHLFERFYRGNQAHSRDIDGSGLGLSIAREIIQAHGGTLTLNTNTSNETGFLISLI